VQVEKERVEKYIDEIASETTDLEIVLARPDVDILQDRHILKSLKYSTIVIAEAIASTLQHILARRHNAVVDGYMEVFRKSSEHHVLPDAMLSRLQPFFSFRNMLVHQYWRVKDETFLANLRDGLGDFHDFARDIRAIICKPSVGNPFTNQGP
jgi:uncharacterized protein YutE (UPF0331/DUF86 family)